ncbi:CAP domain-containing protein [Candidatus Viridilinea mediisalina]|uniref:SCP domain-containing protein n=1 Tax=Candidatus Viridilinea mediisalina TaxID=2024553 RepID=A0A2A6RMS7_9CHLR|nr:CAP domain-containing protein [Candidatus Viridilinea mediisalina]PDW04225.1 hypothetical protein CJ255_04550 [Candidatus Viridilinea mediisalina]
MDRISVRKLPFRTILMSLLLLLALVMVWLSPPQAAANQRFMVFLPLISSPPEAEPERLPTNWIERVNAYRALAGVPPVSEDATLNENCQQHARYVAENRHLTHSQDTSRPWASPEGQHCAQRGNVWIGYSGIWEPYQTIDSWMHSVGHRLWLLYPTTSAVGYGFYSNNGSSGAAMDILSRANMDADSAYNGWPVRYPEAEQRNVPPIAMPISLQWPYFDAAPILTSSQLRTASGTAISHEATTNLPSRHKGIVLTPDTNLPPNTTIEVQVQGSYLGQAFDLRWSFATGEE